MHAWAHVYVYAYVACCVGVSKVKVGKCAYILDVRTLPADVPHFPLMYARCVNWLVYVLVHTYWYTYYK